MHYVRDWEPVLGELARVVAPGGRIVFSTHHPEMTARTFPATQGKDVALVCDRWEKGGEAFDVRFYARSFAAMEASIAASGLTLERWVDAAAVAGVRGRGPGRVGAADDAAVVRLRRAQRGSLQFLTAISRVSWASL